MTSEISKDNICAKCGHKKDWHCLCEEKFKRENTLIEDIEEATKETRMDRIWPKHQNHSSQSETETQVVNDRLNSSGSNNHSGKTITSVEVYDEDYIKNSIKGGSDDASSLSDKKLYGYAGCNPDLIEEEFKTNVPKEETENWMCVYPEEDVKEFVKKLKDAMGTIGANNKNGIQIINHFWKEIDKIFGSALIWKYQ